MEIRKVGVVGLGTMGSNIAIVCARSGMDTIACEMNESTLQSGLGRIGAFLDSGVQKGKTTAGDRDAILARLKGATSITELADCDIVIEAIDENLERKTALFQVMDSVLGEQAIIASNTSTLSITSMGAASGRADRFIGTHFCLPAALNRLVEVAPGSLTSMDTLGTAMAFLKNAGQTPIEVKDTPGFILNYFLIPFQNDCIRMIEAGYAAPADLDAGITLGLGYKMAPMRLLDIEGLDIHRTVSLSLYEQLKDPRYVPPPLVDRMIASGHLGAKTGRGFYIYEQEGVFGVAEPKKEDQPAHNTAAGKPLSDAIRQVGIVGLGAMGSGIAQVCLTAGLEVTGIEMDASALQAGQDRIAKNLAGAVKRGKMDEAGKNEILGRLRGSTDLKELSGCDLIIEVIVEDLGLKLDLFEKLAGIAKDGAIIASNTSCLSVTAMAAKAKYPERVLGLHFFNPPYAMRLVEVIQAVQTAPEILEFGVAFCQRIGKTPVPVKDRPGFLVNRLLVPYLNHAAQAFDDRLADRETMDKAIHMGLGHPMGPLTLLDLVGIDVQAFVADAIAGELGEARFFAPPILRRMTSANWLGRKTGRGFYDYGES
ncbi:MAG: 3-hydroxyacyl-CoA dehydrogenase family protein [Nitrospinota bacterium]